MKSNGPTFTYPASTKHLSPQAVNTVEYDKQPEIINKKTRRIKKTGDSLGWGWFQGFNLFVTIFFLIGFTVFAYFMLGGDQRHEGVPKYILDRSSGSGKVIFNPQLTEEQRRSFEYIPPIKTDIDTAKIAESAQKAKQNIQIILFSGEGLDAQGGSGTASFSGASSQMNPAENQHHIAELLEQAEVALSIGEFVGTEGHDAYYLYQQVLELDPMNRSAREGTNEISHIYFQHAERAFYEGNFQATEQYLSIGLIVNPNNERLKDLQSELNQILYPAEN